MVQVQDFGSFEDLFGISVPNIFTPNNDGLNDVFKISFKSDLSSCFNLRIFDRWGIEQFLTNDPAHGWDGIGDSGQRSVCGTYFYLMQINELIFKGQISLSE
jgi:gliding motility-associated-like protein